MASRFPGSRVVAITRRRLALASVALAGGGLSLSWLRPDAEDRRLASDDAVFEPNAYLQVTPQGEFILQVDKTEIGQGVMTGFATLVAEELDVPPSRLAVRQAPIHPLFQDPLQLTGESNAMRTRWEVLRRTGATARLMLLQAAARRWGAAVDELDTDGQGGVVDAAGGRRLAYAELATDAGRLPVPRRVGLRDVGGYRYIGQQVPRLDIRAKVTGEAAYGIDTRLPGLKVALVRRPPTLGGSVRMHDDAAALAVPGVDAVFAIHSGVAVVADGFWQAMQAVRALDVHWEDGPLASVSTAAVRDGQMAVLAREPGQRVRDEGDMVAALQGAGRHVEARYWLPYLAHATMEPMNATVWFHDGRCQAWVPSQAPDLVRQVICDMSGLSREQVDVQTPFVGGGFGRRATMEYVVEAVEIALRVAHPVKLVWTREDDMRHGLYREATSHQLRAVLDEVGDPVAWQHRLVAATFNALIIPLAVAALAPGWMPRRLVSGASQGLVAAADRFGGSLSARTAAEGFAYAVPNVAVDVCPWNPGVPVTIWRSVGYSYVTFVIESFIDELAAAAGSDPLAYRRRLLLEQPRHLAVLDRLAEASGWQGPAPAGRHRGVAIQLAFGTLVGQVAEVSVDNEGGVRVHRVCCVVDCGTVINPDIVRQQMEGGIIFGLSAALHGEIHIDDGAVRESNFHDYPVVRLAEAPAIDVHIIASDADPSGVGEPGVPPIAPAVANAVFAATGRRLRELPLRL